MYKLSKRKQGTNKHANKQTNTQTNKQSPAAATAASKNRSLVTYFAFDHKIKHILAD